MNDDASQELASFLRGLAHELRTPLGSILILTELLADGPEELSPRQSEQVRKIGLAAAGLKELIEQVSTYAKAAGGRLSTVRTAVDPEALLDELRRAYGPRAREQGRDLVVERKTDVPRTLSTDREVLCQILGHLLDHALGDLSDQPIGLGVELGAADEVTFTVRGARVPQGGASDDLFEPFPPGARRSSGGTVLALPLARALSGVLGGRLRAAGDGALVLSLPLAAAAAAGRLP